MITLYHYWSSTCSQKVRFALEEKGLDWESRHVDLFRFEHWREPYLRLNPGGLVPTLVDGDEVVTDSSVILEYLEDRFDGPSLRPRDPAGRARMRRWFKDADRLGQENAIKAGYNLRIRKRYARYSTEELREAGKAIPDPDMRRSWLDKLERGVPAGVEARAYAGLERLADRMERALGDGTWLAGDDFGLADVSLAPYVERIAVLAHPDVLDAGRRPRLADWRGRVSARPAFGRAFSFENPDPEDPVAR